MLVQAEKPQTMKKFIILLFIALGCIISSEAKTTYESIKFGGNLELIIKTETHWGAREDTKTYGLRKNGVDIAKPEYEQEELFVIDDLSCIIFMNRETQKAHLYSTETGKEIYTYCYKQENQYERFHRFRFEKTATKNQNDWQLAEYVYSDRYAFRSTAKIKAVFRQKNGKIYQLKTKIITYEEEL